MSQRNPALPRSHPAFTATSSPLLSSSTITFLASWRGQLLICTIVLILGGVYFVLQEPISNFRRRRRETLSRVRAEELVSMEKPAEKEIEEVPKEKRGREKKKDSKKRKGSLLKAPIGNSGESSTAVSSMESSPTPVKLALPAKAKDEQIKQGQLVPSRPKTDSSTSPSIAEPEPHSPSPALAASPVIVEKQPSASSRYLSAPCDIPLPESPGAGPSRLASDTDSQSLDGEGENASEASVTHSNDNNEETFIAEPPRTTKSLGFSIIPEEGYLPLATSTPNAKKKKSRKGKPAPSPLPLLDSIKRQSNVDGPDTSQPKVPDSPAIPVTPSRHARKASLHRPINADLDELLTERERTIESLRAEIGIAKAEEAKAKEEINMGKSTEERLKGDVERIRKANQRSEHEGRRREGELAARLNQLSNHYTAALHRIGVLEAMFRESGISLMPPSPAMPPQGHSPASTPIQHLQPMPSPGMPGSPFGMPFGPSPRAVSAGFVPHPSPGIYPSQYPSPMLHPHFNHSSSPSPFRRASTGGPADDLAGPLTPGQAGRLPYNSFSPQLQAVAGSSSGQYPFDLGIMPPPSTGKRPTNPGGPPSAADLRRQSIESSVLRKKGKPEGKGGSESGEESNRSSGPLEGITEAEVQGLGMGDIESVGNSGDVEEHAETGDHGEVGSSGSQDSHSHPSSPSPPTRASMLLTPASADVFHRALLNGADTPDEFSMTSNPDMTGIKIIHDGERGNLYYTVPESRRDSEHGGSDNASVYEPESKLNGHKHTNGDSDGADMNENGPVSDDGKKEDYVPMFASLAHTPQQIAEIQRMREEALKAREKQSARA